MERGHRVAEEKPGAALRGRRHSLVAGTDVHHPTDRSLPMDAARCMVRDVSRACGGPGLRGWRQKEYLWKKLRIALKLAGRAEAGCAEIGDRLGIRGFIGDVRPRADLTGRRILKGGTIPHRGKVHPISGPHTRWIPKGKAGVPVEPGVPVRVPEDRHGFLPHHSVMWEGSDMDVAVPMGGEARARFPDLSVVSFDRGLHSPPDRPGPAGMPEPTPCRGKAGCRRRTASGKAGRRSAGRGAPTPPAGRRRPGCSPYVPATDRPVEAPGGAPTGPATAP